MEGKEKKHPLKTMERHEKPKTLNPTCMELDSWILLDVSEKHQP
jgi:hypothetical protein